MQLKNRQIVYTRSILEAFAHMLKTTAVYTQLSSFVARRNLAGSPAQSQNFSINQMRTAIASPSARNDGCARSLSVAEVTAHGCFDSAQQPANSRSSATAVSRWINLQAGINLANLPRFALRQILKEFASALFACNA